MSWGTVKLGDICTIEKGNIGIMKAIPGQYPLVVLGEERKSHNSYQFEGEAVIIPLVSSTGHGHKSLKRIHFQTGKFAVGSILCAVMPKDRSQLSAEFLYRYLDLNKEKELVSKMKGMANVSLPIKGIASIEIPLPPLSIQKQLTKVLHRLEVSRDQVVSELNNQLFLVKDLRQTLLAEAMQGKLVPQDEHEEPATILLEKVKAEKAKLTAKKRIKREKLSPSIQPENVPITIPDNWIWCRFIDIVEIQSNLVAPLDFPNHPHIAPDNIEKNTGKLLPYKTVSEDNVKSANHYFYAGQLIYSKVRPKLNKVIKVDFEGLCSADMYPLHVYVSPRFLQFYMLSKYFITEVDKFDNRVKMPKINQNQLSQIPVPLPPLGEQQRIVTKLESLMKFCDELETNINQGVELVEGFLKVAINEALEPSSSAEIAAAKRVN